MARLHRILSIDGGGIRGLIPATALVEMERLTSRPISDLFDLIAGTSTGGILACGLAMADAGGRPRYSAMDMREFYFAEGSTIFPQRPWTSLQRPFAEKYPAEGIERVLENHFGEMRLRDTRCDILATSYEISLRAPWFFRSSRARQDSAYDFPLWQVARATSAAPTYFPPARIPRPEGNGTWTLIDGGAFANNPALCAYAEARQGDPAAQALKDVFLVSLGTGRHAQAIRYRPGLLGWAKPVLDVVFDGVSRTTEYQLQQILPPVLARRRYYRLQTDLTAAADAMDDATPRNLLRLKQQAESLVETERADLEELCAELVK